MFVLDRVVVACTASKLNSTSPQVSAGAQQLEASTLTSAMQAEWTFIQLDPPSVASVMPAYGALQQAVANGLTPNSVSYFDAYAKAVAKEGITETTAVREARYYRCEQDVNYLKATNAPASALAIAQNDLATAQAAIG